MNRKTLRHLILPLLLLLGTTASAGTVEAIKQRGHLNCGVNSGLPGFAMQDKNGKWSGMEVDFCHALSAAVFGKPDKVRFIPQTTSGRLKALQQGEIDLLAHNTTWTMSRDLGMGLDFIGVYYYDGQGFMVPRTHKARSALGLDDSTVCVIGTTTSEANLKEYFQRHQMRIKLVRTDSSSASLKQLQTGGCDVVTSDQSQLYSLRSQLDNPTDYKILPEPISKEPLGPVVRDEDNRWRKLAQWTLFTLINAEEEGINSHNVDRVLQIAQVPEVLRLLGKSGETGKALGVANDWPYQVIRHVGNYAEIFERNLGKNTPIRMKRGLNSLWNQGGLLYAPPAR